MINKELLKANAIDVMETVIDRAERVVGQNKPWRAGIKALDPLILRYGNYEKTDDTMPLPKSTCVVDGGLWKN